MCVEVIFPKEFDRCQSEVLPGPHRHLFTNQQAQRILGLPSVRPKQTTGREEENKTHPVKNIFPILALEKLNTLDGLTLFTTSKFSRFKNDRMSSFF